MKKKHQVEPKLKKEALQDLRKEKTQKENKYQDEPKP